MNTTYYISRKLTGEDTPWYKADAKTLRSAKAECTKVFGNSFQGSLLMVAVDAGSHYEVLAQKLRDDTRWTNLDY